MQIGSGRRGFVVLACAALVGACAHFSSATPRTEAPPLENGVYVSTDICQGEGGCDTMHWRVGEKPIALRDRLDPAAPVIATLQPGEYVDVLNGQIRTMLQRGVVKSIAAPAPDAPRETGPSLKVGDVVYNIASEGEGYFTLWRRGETVIWMAPEDETSGVQIAWAAAPSPPPGAVLGFWVQVKRANGQTGWAGDGGFECVSKLAGDENCEAQ